LPLKIALLGTGRIADEELAPAISQADDAELWSVLSRDPTRAAGFANRHGAAAPEPAHASLEHLLADPELDAVVVATPDGLHAGQAIAAARAGKHVLVEKPMATTLDDARAMIDACREADVRLGVAYHMRWHDGHRRLAQRIHAGELGRIHHMRVHWTFLARDASNWRASPEVGRWWGLAGVGTHCLDQVRWLMGPSCGEVTRVASVVDRSVWKGPHDETAVVAAQFESGSTAEICSSVLFASPRRMEVYAAGGIAICDDTLGPLGAGTMTLDGEPFHFEPTSPYTGEIVDFAAAVRDGREPEVGGEEGARNVELLIEATL
jgi:1,5-anhydro-D-fructose reductase (1,5-anhydro-D-mannitol-forming)